MASNINGFVSPEDWLNEDSLELIAGWARDGYSFSDIAKRIGISAPQLTKWRNEYPEIADALKKGSELIDYKVESALLKAALGYKTKETTIITTLRNGKTVETTTQTVTKEVPPNVPACQTWLYNRRSDKWKNRNSKSSIVDDLNDNPDISITITRANSRPNDLDDGKWQEEVNQSVSLQGKKREKVEKNGTGNEQKRSKKEDLDYWPEDWEDE